jgi:hypothetical protein
MSNKLCMARLTDFAKTKSVNIGNSKHRCSRVKVCTSEAMEGNDLCEYCFLLPKEGRYKDGKYHGRNVHGLITEPIPEDSHIYGSSWYKGVVELYGSLEDEEWIKLAEEAQQNLEEEVRKRVGNVVEDKVPPKQTRKKEKKEEKPIEDQAEEKEKKEKKKVQRGRRNKVVEDEEEMPPKQANKGPDKGQKTTLLQSFTPIKQFYVESEKQPKQLATDSMKMKKVVEDGKEIWLIENGMKFTVDTNGEVGELIK